MIGNNIYGLPEEIISTNQTMAAIINCCVKSVPGMTGLKSIVTYNYDNLLELGLEKFQNQKDNFQPVFRGNQKLEDGKIPIYHVHGYIPYQNNDANYDEIIFSEDQYNRAFQDPFFWGNVVQVNQLTNQTGLMIGLSLSDRNIRRILDSIRNQPVFNDNYILMRKPKFKMFELNSPEINHIREKAGEYMQKFARARMKMPEMEQRQILHILENIYRYEENEFEKGFENLGLKLITFDEFEEIPEILANISTM
jgi:ribosomal protein L22